MAKVSSRRETARLTGQSILIALVVVLAVLSTFIKFGPFSINLALVPMVIGGCLYGVSSGAMLGAVCGIVFLLTGLLGWDGGTVMYLVGLHPLALIVICIGKTAAAGAIAALVYKVFKKKNETVGTVCASIITPIINTGVFVVGMLLFFFDVMSGWASGQNMMLYIITAFVGVNFFIEMAVIIILSTGITRIVKTVGK